MWNTALSPRDKLEPSRRLSYIRNCKTKAFGFQAGDVGARSWRKASECWRMQPTREYVVFSVLFKVRF